MFHDCDKWSNILSYEVSVIEMRNAPSRNVHSSLNPKISFDSFETTIREFFAECPPSETENVVMRVIEGSFLAVMR